MIRMLFLLYGRDRVIRRVGSERGRKFLRVVVGFKVGFGSVYKVDYIVCCLSFIIL